jgi:hypothetical protein
MNPLVFLKGETLGKTIYNGLVFVAIIGLAGYIGLGIVSGKFWHWRADKANERADRAEAVAETASRNAANADGSAQNATFTRDNMDRDRIEITLKTEQAATRVENATTTVGDDGGLDPDLMRELEAARDNAGSAARRLQRAGSGPGAP